MNARRVGDTARSPPPCMSASPLARFGQHDGPAMWRGLRSSHLLLSGRRRSRASNRAGRGDLNRPVLRPDYMSSAPADAMTDVTQLVLLSVCLELHSEYAELFLNIFCGLSHSISVKVASQSIPGGETAGQQ